MKKTVSVNLNSFMFNIDEDAFEMLNLYLSKLQDHFAKLDEGAEIVRDIEARIAEIFLGKINNGKQVINLTDVEELIQILGNVDDITGEDSKTANEEPEATTQKKSKKLYRNPDDKMLGGVCSGLAEYTGISTTTWRIVFLVFIFVGQLSIIAYLILLVAVPEAKTTAQKIEMKGEKINLSNIEKTVRQEYDDFRKNFRKMDKNKFSAAMSNVGNGIWTAVSLFTQVFGKVLGVLFLLAGAAVLVVLTIAFLGVGSDRLFYSEGFLNMVWLPGILEYVTSSSIAWLMSISILIVLIIPVIAIINWGVILLFEIRTNKYLSYSTFAIWVIAIIMTAVSGLNIGFSFKALDVKTVSETIVSDTTNTYNFVLNPAIEDYKFPKDEEIDNFDDIHAIASSHFIKMEDGLIQYNISNIKFLPTEDSLAYIEIKYYARGGNNTEARENLSQIEYNYSIDTALVFLDPYIKIAGKKFRAQRVRVIAYIPTGKMLFVDPRLSPIADIEEISGKYSKSELCGTELLSTKKGFVLVD